MESETRARYERLLGAYVARTTEIENRMNHVIGAFFNVTGPISDPFEWWVMGRLEFSAKLQILHRFLEFMGEKTAFKELMSLLTKMMERRNELAHGHYTQVVMKSEGGQWIEGPLIASHSKLKFNFLEEMKQLHLDELEGELAQLDRVFAPLDRFLTLAMNMWPHDVDSDGKSIHHEGTFAELREKQLQKYIPKG